MSVPWEEFNGRHLTTTVCAKGASNKRRRQVEEEGCASAASSLQAYGRTLEVVASLKYLGRILVTSANDWLVVVSNLSKVRRKWERFSRILGQEGEDARISSTFYKTFFQ